MAWSLERTELCVKWWNEGLSASTVAMRLGGGVSRNAVIGKIHRLGLSHTVTQRKVKCKKRHPVGRRSPGARNKGGPGNINPDRLKITAPKVSTMPLPPEPERPEKLFKLADIEDHQCRFPYGDPKTEDFGFCGCAKVPGSPYCAGHHAMCLAAPEPRKRARVSDPDPLAKYSAAPSMATGVYAPRRILSREVLS